MKSERIKALEEEMPSYVETKDGHPVFNVATLCSYLGIPDPVKAMRFASDFAEQNGLKLPIFVSRNES